MILSGRNIDENLNELFALPGGCERIANTPVPFAYALICSVRSICLYPSAAGAVCRPSPDDTVCFSAFISYDFPVMGIDCRRDGASVWYTPQ